MATNETIEGIMALEEAFKDDYQLPEHNYDKCGDPYCGYCGDVDPSEEFYAAIGSSMKKTEEWDIVNKPQHYHKNGMEVIDIIDAFTPDSYSYYMGNAIKYLLRHQDKGVPAQDLEKCKWYIDRMIKDWRNN